MNMLQWTELSRTGMLVGYMEYVVFTSGRPLGIDGVQAFSHEKETVDSERKWQGGG